MSDTPQEEKITQRELKEKVWHTVLNGGIKEAAKAGAPLWALAQLWLLWAIYTKLEAMALTLAQLAQAVK